MSKTVIKLPSIQIILVTQSIKPFKECQTYIS